MADLPERLRAAADAHRPDRERMLARVEQAIAAPDAEPAPPWREHAPPPWMRVGAVAAAVAGAIGLGGLAVGAVSGGGPDQPAATSQAPGPVLPTSGAPTPTAGAPDTRLPSGRTEGGTASRGATPSRPPGRTAGPKSTAGGAGAPGAAAGGTATPSSTPAGPVRASGSLDPHSNPYWTESDVHLTTTEQLASLTVEVRVSPGSGTVTPNGSFTSAPGVSVAVSTLSDGGLLYRWTLSADQVLAPGSYTFGAQFNHTRATRDTAADQWSATAATGTAATAPARFAGRF
jgi:hypothetical protein